MLEDNRVTDRLRAWGPAAAWAAVLFFLSASPMQLDGGWRWIAINDKVVHLCLYAVLGVALAYVRRSGVRIPHAVLIAIGALYGASDEWHQSLVPGRSPSFGDWVADLTGVLVGYGLATLAAARLERRAGNHNEEAAT